MPEAVELERAAEWRLRLVDARPDDARSAAAARQLQKLADDLREMQRRLRAEGTQAALLLHEYRCICNWLGESEDISDLALLAHEYRTAIGFGQTAETGEDYLRALIALANKIFGTM